MFLELSIMSLFKHFSLFNFQDPLDSNLYGEMISTNAIISQSLKEFYAEYLGTITKGQLSVVDICAFIDAIAVFDKYKDQNIREMCMVLQ